MSIMQTSSLDSFELLAGTTLVSGMSLEQIRILSDSATQETYSDGESLVTWEDTRFDLLLVIEGKCEIRTSMDDVLYRLGPNSLIGEVSFLDSKPRSAKAVAMGECKAVRFPVTLLDDFERSHPDILAKLLRNIGVVLCQKLRSTTRFAEASFV